MKGLSSPPVVVCCLGLADKGAGTDFPGIVFSSCRMVDSSREIISQILLELVSLELPEAMASWLLLERPLWGWPG